MLGIPRACTDVMIYKYRPDGQLAFFTYLSGVHREVARFIGFGSGGALVIAGTTESPDFPSTIESFQPRYGGPLPVTTPSASGDPAGDFFAAVLDPESGALRAGTFLGGPGRDEMGEAALASDGSLYFVPKWLVSSSAGMPVSPGSLQQECLGTPCSNGYVARLSADLDRMLFGTYLPGVIDATAELHADGTVYYAGSDGAGFVPTANAWQRQPAGAEDAIVARLDAQGRSLLFGTYVGTAKTDWILRMAVAPDGSVWASVNS